MTVNTNDILQVVIDYQYPGAGTALNILYYKLFDPAQEDDDVLDALETFFETEWGARWADLASADSVLNNMDVQVVSQTGEVIRDVGSRILDVNGLLSSTTLPAANSVYLLGYTNIPQVRGAKYVPAISEESTFGGVLTPPASATAALLVLDYLANVNIDFGVNLVPGVVSKREGDFVPFIDSGTFNMLPAYQRRRKEGVGS